MYFLIEPNDTEYFNLNIPHSIPLTYYNLESWYPHNFSERIDYILSTVSKYSDYPGKIINMTYENTKSLFFINRFSNGNFLSDNEIFNQVEYISTFLLSQGLLKNEASYLTILPNGWKRITELQRNNSNSKQAFIAISFSDDMKLVQTEIELGISRSGYNPLSMNEYEHNKQIVPEIMYQIKKSKCLVA
jgi:hypothetical protein